jgi:DNA-binding response OmpR family regulator
MEHLHRESEKPFSEIRIAEDDTRSFRVSGGEKIRLGPNEFRILLALWKERGAIVSTDDLLGFIYGEPEEDQALGINNTLARLVANVRSKLESASSGRFTILNVQSFGYQLVDEQRPDLRSSIESGAAALVRARLQQDV